MSAVFLISAVTRDELDELDAFYLSYQKLDPHRSIMPRPRSVLEDSVRRQVLFSARLISGEVKGLETGQIVAATAAYFSTFDRIRLVENGGNVVLPQVRGTNLFKALYGIRSFTLAAYLQNDFDIQYCRVLLYPGKPNKEYTLLTRIYETWQDPPKSLVTKHYAEDLPEGCGISYFKLPDDYLKNIRRDMLNLILNRSGTDPASRKNVLLFDVPVIHDDEKIIGLLSGMDEVVNHDT